MTRHVKPPAGTRAAQGGPLRFRGDSGMPETRLTPDVDRGAQLEIQPAFRGELEVLLALRRHDGTRRAAHHRANRRAFAAAGDAADDGPQAGAAADLAAGLLALTLALALVVAAGHRVDEAAEPDGAQLQRDLVAALHLAGLLDVDGLEDRRRAARDDDGAVHHHRIVDDGLERHPRLR